MYYVKHQPVKQGQTTTSGTLYTSLCEKCVGSLKYPANQDAGDGTYGLLSLSEKTRTSNHLQMSLQRQHILLSYFKILSVGPVWGSTSRPPAQQSGALPIEPTRRRHLKYLKILGVHDINSDILMQLNGTQPEVQDDGNIKIFGV